MEIYGPRGPAPDIGGLSQAMEVVNSASTIYLQEEEEEGKRERTTKKLKRSRLFCYPN